MFFCSSSPSLCLIIFCWKVSIKDATRSSSTSMMLAAAALLVVLLFVMRRRRRRRVGRSRTVAPTVVTLMFATGSLKLINVMTRQNQSYNNRLCNLEL